MSQGQRHCLHTIIQVIVAVYTEIFQSYRGVANGAVCYEFVACARAINKSNSYEIFEVVCM